MNWFLLALFFGYQYAARSCAGTFGDEIRTAFRIDAAKFADFGAWCMLAYSCLQIPFGIALDRIGIRRIVLISFAVCLAGNYTFTHAQTFETARVGRLLLGIGGVPAYMSAVKFIADEFSITSAGFFIGLTRAVGSALVIAGNPLLKSICLNGEHSWQQSGQCCTASGRENVLPHILHVLVIIPSLRSIVLVLCFTGAHYTAEAGRCP